MNQTVIDAAQAAIGHKVDMQGPLPGGWNNGAYAVTVNSEPFVLKVHGQRTLAQLRAIRAAVDVAQQQGWPTPAWQAAGETSTGECWSLCERVVGESPHVLDEISAEAIIRANERQAGLAALLPDAHVLINRSDVATQYLEHDSYGTIAKVRSFDPLGAQVVERFLGGLVPVRLPTLDLVHGDYNQENILLNRGEVAAFVDTDELGVGTRAFDLVDLFHRSWVKGDHPAGRNLLRQRAIELIGRDGFLCCLATTIFGTMSWLIERDAVWARQRAEQLLQSSF